MFLKSFNNGYLYRVAVLYLRYMAIGLICISGQVFAGTVTVKLKSNTIYRGYIVAYTDSTVVLETDSFDRTRITIKYNTISEIRSGDLSQVGPVDRSDIQNFISEAKPKNESKTPDMTTQKKSIVPPDTAGLAFSYCYDDSLLLWKMERIQAMSDAEFVKLLSFIDTCWVEMKRVGILVNPGRNRVYRKLHLSVIDSISGREFQVLQKLRGLYFDFQETVEWDVNLCEDSVYRVLQQKSDQGLSNAQMLYLQQLHGECREVRDDLGDEYRRHWVTGQAMVSDKIFEYYDPPGSGKVFLTIGGVLFIPGIILPIVGGTLVGDDGGEGVVEEIEEGFGEFFGRLFLGIGIACDIAGLSLISIGVVKNQNADKYEKLKNEYELYKQKQAEGASINFNFTF